ncbi:PrsW family intramembrane metalloprotease [Corynebacterium sp. TAE3-ERU30]|uniref:PrsW family intramembrane metalloprotease n=1 Tax=Corynebacterium sp. TAE3-ERU30 TaxID=2849496 RepID=UPI001C45B60A|nr:PrsW family intramembrane metalloprotease [Corynebacterium sp. TAE3-ERU30]MBV7282269.1 PrsW family intramembrane metalloprotease [Corynebacterium sp. TAE3-ERU30]
MSTIYRISMIVMIVICIPIGLGLVGGTAVLSPQGFGVGIPCALLYAVVIISLLRRTPLWPSTRTAPGLRRSHVLWWAVAAMSWGAFASFGLTMLSGGPIMALTSKLGWDIVEASLGGAYPEEISKVLGVVLIIFAFRFLNRPWHGFITGALVGLGFEITENLLYGTVGAVYDPASDFWGALQMWGLRTLFGVGLHVVLSAIAGWGVGYALLGGPQVARLSTPRRILIALGWLLASFVGHFWWNLQWGNMVAMGVSIALAACYIYGLFIVLLVRLWKQAKRDTGYVLCDKPLLAPPPTPSLSL